MLNFSVSDCLLRQLLVGWPCNNSRCRPPQYCSCSLFARLFRPSLRPPGALRAQARPIKVCGGECWGFDLRFVDWPSGGSVIKIGAIFRQRGRVQQVHFIAHFMHRPRRSFVRSRRPSVLCSCRPRVACASSHTMQCSLIGAIGAPPPAEEICCCSRVAEWRVGDQWVNFAFGGVCGRNYSKQVENLADDKRKRGSSGRIRIPRKRLIFHHVSRRINVTRVKGKFPGKFCGWRIGGFRCSFLSCFLTVFLSFPSHSGVEQRNLHADRIVSVATPWSSLANDIRGVYLLFLLLPPKEPN